MQRLVAWAATLLGALAWSASADETAMFWYDVDLLLADVFPNDHRGPAAEVQPRKGEAGPGIRVGERMASFRELRLSLGSEDD